MSVNARLVRLRQIFSDPGPIEDKWVVLCGLFGDWSGGAGFDVLLEYADSHMKAQGWPDEVRSMPRAWAERAAQSTVGRAEWLLARSLTREVGIDLERFQALARNSGIRHLTRLSIKNCGLADRHLRMLMDVPWPSLEHLDLSSNELTPGGAVFLSRTSALPALRSLDLTGNLIGREGALSLSAPEHMPDLSSVNLTRCGVNAETFELIKASAPMLSLASHAGGFEAGGLFFHAVRSPGRAIYEQPLVEANPADLLEASGAAELVAESVNLDGAPLSSWLLARLWHMTDNRLDLRTDKALWLEGGRLVLPLYASDPGGREIARLDVHLGRERAQVRLMPLRGATDWEVLRRSERALVPLLASAPAQVARCRVVICDLERARAPWECGWGGSGFLGGAGCEFVYDSSYGGFSARQARDPSG